MPQFPIPEPSPTLVQAIRERRAIAIVGSGLSSAAGAPSWSALLEGIAEECRKTQPRKANEIDAAVRGIAQAEFLDAAEIFKKILGHEFRRVIQRQIPRNLAPTRSHEILIRLGFRGFITLNYDLLLESAARSQGIDLTTYSSSNPNLGAVLQARNPFLIKLHGDVNHPLDLVLTRSEYRELARKTDLLEILSTLFRSNVIFWVGYGYRDSTLERIRDNALPQPPEFSIAAVRDPLFESKMETLGVSMAWLEMYDELQAYLECLEALVAGGKIEHPLSPRRIHFVYAIEDRPAVRELIHAYRVRGFAASWDRDRPPWEDGPPLDASDVVVVYGSADLYRSPFIQQQVYERAAALGGRLITLQEAGALSGQTGGSGNVVPFGTLLGRSPVDALIEHLKPEPAGRQAAKRLQSVRELLEEALRANWGIPTDTITDRIFLTEQAADLTVQAYETLRRLDAPDVNDRFRADLEYARLLRFRGHWIQAERHLELLSNSAASAHGLNPDLYHLILLEQGALVFERGSIHRGIADVERALNYFESKGELELDLVKALRQLGNMVVEQGKWPEATELLRSAVYLANFFHSNRLRRGQPDQVASLLWIDCLRELGSCLLRQERVDESLIHFQRALAEVQSPLLQPVGHHVAGVLCYHIGRAHYLYTGDLREADRYLRKGLDILERYDNPVRLAFFYEHLARVGMKLPPGDSQEWILAYFERALTIRERTGHTYMTAKARLGLGDFHFGHGDFARSRVEYEKARRICYDHDKKPELARSLHRLGRAYACEKDPDEAQRHLKQAEKLFQELGLTNPLREVEFELLQLQEPRILELTFEELIAKGQARDYEFCVNEVGEYAIHSFIRKLTERPARRAPKATLAEIDVGIGDDAAVLRVLQAQSFDVVLTTDAAPGSICQSPDLDKGRYAAKFSVVHTLSDLLAMGATPIAILLNLYLKRDAKLEYAMRIVETVHREAQRYGATLIGGDLKERPEQSIGCVGVGLVHKEKILRRSGARAGHVVAITQAALEGGGLRRIGKRWAQEILENRRLTKESPFDSFAREDWKEKLLFLPFQEMLAAAETGKVRSAIDTSDGVLACLQLIGRESKVSFLLEEKLIEELIDPDVRKVATSLGFPPVQFLFNAGHDWEIVLTVAEEDFPSVREAVRRTGGDLAPLGRVIPRSEELRGGVAWERIDGRRYYVRFFTDEKFVRKPYQERPFEWEDLKFELEGGRPLTGDLDLT